MLSKPADLTPAQGLAFKQALDASSGIASKLLPFFTENLEHYHPLEDIAKKQFCNQQAVQTQINLLGRKLLEVAADFPLPLMDQAERKRRMELKKEVYRVALQVFEAHPSLPDKRPKMIADLIQECRNAYDQVGQRRKHIPAASQPDLF